MVPASMHRNARHHEVAELLPASIVTVGVEDGSKENVVLRETLLQLHYLVTQVLGAEHRHIAGNLLEANDVRISHLAHHILYSTEIHPAIDTESGLDVPGQDLHHLIPARIND